MPFTNTATNQALDAMADVAPSVNLIGFASLHSAYSAAGANELTGGSPAYARVAVSWASAASGQKSLTGSPSAFNVPSAATVAWIGLWSAATSGTFAGMGPNGAAPQFGFTSTPHAGSPADTITAPNSAYTAGQPVVVFPGQGGTLPAGLTAGTIYYVFSPSGAAFQLSATVTSPAAVNLGSVAASGLVQAITVETYGSQGFFTINTDTLSVV